MQAVATRPYTIGLVGAGWDLPATLDRGKFVGTVQQSTGLVWHCFADTEAIVPHGVALAQQSRRVLHQRRSVRLDRAPRRRPAHPQLRGHRRRRPFAPADLSARPPPGPFGQHRPRRDLVDASATNCPSGSKGPLKLPTGRIRTGSHRRLYGGVDKVAGYRDGDEALMEAVTPGIV